jgi:hypothetical protein
MLRCVWKFSLCARCGVVGESIVLGAGTRGLRLLVCTCAQLASATDSPAEELAKEVLDYPPVPLRVPYHLTPKEALELAQSALRTKAAAAMAAARARCLSFCLSHR